MLLENLPCRVPHGAYPVESVDGLGNITVTAYNAAHQPTSVTVGSGTSAAATTTTTYDLAGFVASVTDPDGSGTVQTIYIRGDQQNQLLASVAAGDTVSWYLQDHLESVRGITNAAGALVQSIDYDAYGNTTSSGFGTFGYAGMQYGAETGMYWTANRVYDPSTGRWYSQDPLGGTPDSNPYRYVGNEPTNCTDPAGLYEWPWSSKAQWSWNGSIFSDAGNQMGNCATNMAQGAA